MHLEQDVWLPCKTKPGTFADERMVLIDDVLAFVQLHDLLDPDGPKPRVRARVIEKNDRRYKAQIRGAAVGSNIVERPI